MSEVDTRVCQDDGKTSCISDYATLLSYLAHLPEPRPGQIRVYRGQVEHFAAMLPTALRPQAIAENSELWSIWVEESARRVMRSISDGRTSQPQEPTPLTTRGSPLAQLALLSVWLRALAQHYGPGSEFLDVTTSVQIALWFALHRPEPSRDVALVPKNAAQLLRGETETVTEGLVDYRASSKPGWFYVLDVPQWDGEQDGVLGHGSLINLAEPPSFFSTLADLLTTSERILAQHACLIRGDPAVDGGDLSHFYACPPISVALPMTGASLIDMTTDEIFPPPDRDKWYRKLLSAPFALRLRNSTTTISLMRSLPVVHYGTSSLGQQFLLPYFTLPRMSSLYDHLLSQNEQFRSFIWATRTPPSTIKVSMSDATTIVLEAPLFRHIASPLYNEFFVWSNERDQENFTTETLRRMWNHEVLSSDLADRVDVYDPLVPSNVCGSVGLGNVFVEFSPLEGEADRGKESEKLPRAIWLWRGPGCLVTSLYWQDSHNRIWKEGENRYIIRSDTRTFARYSAGVWHEVDEMKELRDLALLATLQMLRWLSPGLKAEAVARTTAPSTEPGHFITSLEIREQTAKLLRATFRGHKRYVVRSTNPGKPFWESSIRNPMLLGNHPNILVVDSEVPWYQGSAASLRAYINQNFKDDEDR